MGDIIFGTDLCSTFKNTLISPRHNKAKLEKILLQWFYSTLLRFKKKFVNKRIKTFLLMSFLMYVSSEKNQFQGSKDMAYWIGKCLQTTDNLIEVVE